MGLNGFKWVHVNFTGSKWVYLIDLFLNGSKRIWVLNGVGSKWGGSKWGGLYHFNISNHFVLTVNMISDMLQTNITVVVH